ncbi:MAG: resolvase [Methanobrevibacter sp.]|nr:resolvase [Methanobrevibacter sp.]
MKKQENNEELRKIHINETLSSKKIMELIDSYPNLKEITCPPSIYGRISKKYLEALKELGIEIKKEYGWNTEKKYKDTDKNKVLDLIKKGYTPSEIANILNFSIKTVYYLKDRDENERIILKKGKKSKYDNETRNKIKLLAKEGISPKKIAEQENIPLRTIYYIINNKKNKL